MISLANLLCNKPDETWLFTTELSPGQYKGSQSFDYIYINHTCMYLQKQSDPVFKHSMLDN